MKWLSFAAFGVITAVIIGGVVFLNRTPVRVVKSTAQGWLWVAPDQQQQFIEELRDYARGKALQFDLRRFPGPPWNMTHVILTTPKANEIDATNATARDKFSVSITLLHPEENWRSQWDDLRARLIARYKWEDVQ
jgi:hypothetical protein